MEYSHKLIEELMLHFQQVIGVDYNKYKNHVYRVFLNCLLLDNKKDNEEKYAISAVFHDIGIWTNHTIDYLNPSIEQARIYLAASGKQEWVDEITSMIQWHHKISRYHGGAFQETIENFRKADWIDVSLGWLTFGVSRRKIRSNNHQLPNIGFHFFLIRKIIKNFFDHPLNPLPMFRR